MEVKELTDKELLVKVKEVSGSEREATLSVLYYIIELDRRKLYTDAGYSSLFSFLHQELGYSEAGAGRRIAAARCLAECSELGEKFLRREVSIATMSTVSKQLREEKEGALRKGSGEKRSRHIPREIRDQVLVRDGMRCTFQGEDGKRCTETRYLTVEHRTPFALGGGHNPENLCALCNAHNQHMARKVFGNKFMSQFG